MELEPPPGGFHECQVIDWCEFLLVKCVTGWICARARKLVKERKEEWTKRTRRQKQVKNKEEEDWQDVCCLKRVREVLLKSINWVNSRRAARSTQLFFAKCWQESNRRKERRKKNFEREREGHTSWSLLWLTLAKISIILLALFAQTDTQLR